MTRRPNPSPARRLGSALLGLLVLTSLPLAAMANELGGDEEPPPDDASLYVIVQAKQRPLDGLLVLPPAVGKLTETAPLLRGVVHNDMRLSGVVRALEMSEGAAANLQRRPVPHLEVDRKAAKAAGVTFAVGMWLRRKRGDKRLAELHTAVVDVRQGQLLDLGPRANQVGPLTSLRTMAHRASNAIFGALTGVEGSFDTQIAYSAPGPGCARCIWLVDADGYDPRPIVHDKGVHMLPSVLGDLGIAYVSFRTDLPSLFKLSGPAVNQRYARAPSTLADETRLAPTSTKRSKRGKRGKRGKRRGRAERRGKSNDPVTTRNTRRAADGKDAKDAKPLDGRNLGVPRVEGLAPAVPPPLPGLVPTIDLGEGPHKPFAEGEDLQFRTLAESPDGRYVATINNGEQADIWLLDKGGKPVRNLTEHEADDLSPSFSPDGRQLAFVSNRSGKPQVYVMAADGTGLRRLTWAGPYNTDPDWGPDGRIAFSGLRGGAVDVQTVDLEGHIQRLTPGRGRRSLEPTWSPCGKRLVYVSDEDGGKPRLWITSHDGAVREPLPLPGGRYYTPAWRRRPGEAPARRRR